MFFCRQLILIDFDARIDPSLKGIRPADCVIKFPTFLKLIQMNRASARLPWSVFTDLWKIWTRLNCVRLNISYNAAKFYLKTQGDPDCSESNAMAQIQGSEKEKDHEAERKKNLTSVVKIS